MWEKVAIAKRKVNGGTTTNGTSNHKIKLGIVNQESNYIIELGQVGSREECQQMKREYLQK